MREEEIAALTDEFFGHEVFDLRMSIALLGSPMGSDDIDGRRFTYLRPDSRWLARVDLQSPPWNGPPEQQPVDAMLLVLRGDRMYSREKLEQLFGPAYLTEGPPDESGEAPLQLEFDLGEGVGKVAVRWNPTPEDPSAMGEPGGPDEVRVEEVFFQRGAGEPEQGTTESGGVVYEDVAPTGLQFNEGLDLGAWMADACWRLLRSDFHPQNAAWLGAPQGQPDHQGNWVWRPGNPRLGAVTLRVGPGVLLGALLEPPAESAPWLVALDALVDRLNAIPLYDAGEIRLRTEQQHSRGVVRLVTTPGRSLYLPMVWTDAVELFRG